MKSEYCLAIAASAILLVSCASTNFTEFRGPNIVEGKGGTIRTAKGIDFWDNGEPDRKYRILGVIDDSRGEGLASALTKDGTIAKVAKQHGGDAVIFVRGANEFRGVNLQTGDVNYRRMSKFVVVKYIQ